MALPAAPLSSTHAGHARAGSYERRRPEGTVLYRVVEQHGPALRERAEEAGGLPRFVVRELEEFLRCGRLEFGCLRLACDECGFERLVGFSCRRRGFCSTIWSRRAKSAVTCCSPASPASARPACCALCDAACPTPASG